MGGLLTAAQGCIQWTRRNRFSDKNDILTALRARLDAGLPIDPASLNRPTTAGGDTTLVPYGRRYFRSWADAMAAAAKRGPVR